MSAAEKKIASALRSHVARIEPIIPKGTLADYYAVYTAHTTNNHDDWLKVFSTRLYQKHGFEYCVLLEVVKNVR